MLSEKIGAKVVGVGAHSNPVGYEDFWFYPGVWHEVKRYFVLGVYRKLGLIHLIDRWWGGLFRLGVVICAR